MSWDARQRAMLEAMGLRVWAPMPRHGLEPPVTGLADPEPGVRAVPGTDLQARPAEPQQERHEDQRAAPTQQASGPVASTAPNRPASKALSPRGHAAVEPLAGQAADQTAASPLTSLLPAALEAAQMERVQAIHSLDWTRLREHVAACRACGLCEGRQQTVFGVGHEQAHWMIVGEAPGEQEDLQGEPFVGQAGKLLDNMLRALGLGRGDAEASRQVFIANTLKCRPPRNRNPEPAELARCLPYLQRQIELVKPRIILALGRFAVQSLLQRSEAIGRLRGQVHDYQGIPVVVSYHPAYLLRNLPDKARAWEDLCLARAAYLRGLGEKGEG